MMSSTIMVQGYIRTASILFLWTLLLSCSCLAEEEKAAIEIAETGATATTSYDFSPCSNYTAAERARVRERLFADLLDSYNPHVKPESNRSVVTVSVDLAVVAVSELNNLDGTFVMDSWFRLYWNDVRLSWNPEDYCGISLLPIPQNLMWIPDIYIWVLGNEPTKTTWGATLASVSPNGDVFLSNARKDKVPCKLNLRNFPKDTQECKFSAGSWMYPSGDVQTIPFGDTVVPGGYAKTTDDPGIGMGIDLSYFVQQATHSVDKILVETKLAHYTKEAFPLVQVDYTFFIRRASYTYVSTIAWPMLIVTFLATLNPNFHPLAPGKSILAVTLLLTLSAIQITASNYVPKIGYPTALLELYSVCLGYVLASVMEAGVSVYLATVARDARYGYLQWHIPFLTRIMDFLFWYIGVGGMVWKKRIKKWYKKRRRNRKAKEEAQKSSTKGDDTPKSLNANDCRDLEFEKSYGEDVEGGSAVKTELDGIVEMNRKCGPEDEFPPKVELNRSPTSETLQSTSSSSSSRRSKRMPAKQKATLNLNYSYSARIKMPARFDEKEESEHRQAEDEEEEQEQEETLRRRYTTKMPAYTSLLLVDDAGDHFLKDTWGKLIELYKGEAESHSISKGDLLQAQRLFYTQLAIYIDQLSALVMPVSFIIYATVIMQRYGLSLFADNSDLDEALPSIEGIPGVWPE